MTMTYVTNFNNLHRGFFQLVNWLGHDQVIVIDNASTWEPLLKFYDLHPMLYVMRQTENLGPYAFWELGLHKQQAERFIVTDPDVVPADGCPSASQTVAHMNSIMDDYQAGKVGPSLRIDNLPDHFKHKQDVIKWEKHFWDQMTLLPDAYHADIDTTLAMYEPGSEVRHDKPCLRLAPPYSFEHVPWYEDLAAVNMERDYYLAHIRKDWT